MRHILILTFCFLASPALAEEFKIIDSVDYKQFYEFANKFDGKSHTIPSDEFLKKMSEPNVVIADLREKHEYDYEHIKGAVHLGPDITTERLAAIAPSKDTTILLYCRNSLMMTRMISLTTIALPQVAYLGYPNVYRLQDVRDENIYDELPFERKAEQVNHSPAQQVDAPQ